MSVRLWQVNYWEFSGHSRGLWTPWFDLNVVLCVAPKCCSQEAGIQEKNFGQYLNSCMNNVRQQQMTIKVDYRQIYIYIILFTYILFIFNIYMVIYNLIYMYIILFLVTRKIDQTEDQWLLKNKPKITKNQLYFYLQHFAERSISPISQ